MNSFELVTAVRKRFRELLQGPGIAWNLNGVTQAFDVAVAEVALKSINSKEVPSEHEAK